MYMEQNSEGLQPPSRPTKRATIAINTLYISPETPDILYAQASVYIHTNETIIATVVALLSFSL